MTAIVRLPIKRWDAPHSADEQQRAGNALESGSVLLFPQLSFEMQEGEGSLFTSATAGRGKNISLDLASGTVRGTSTGAEELKRLRRMMKRYAELSRALVCRLLPRYEVGLTKARTSFRPVEIAGRSISWRKDDTRLHVDSFSSSPTQGKRILRVFSNVNPHGQKRAWRLGEPFESVARRYAPSLPRPAWGAGLMLEMLGITKGRRSDYDHFMLRLHDRMKADLAYQAVVPYTKHEFGAGGTWMLFTDQVSHAAMSGQFALEQTFLLTVDSLHDPSQAPLRVLERVLGRALI